MPYVEFLRDRIGRAGLTLCLCVVASVSHAIVKSPFDHRDYRHIILDNGLEAILVSDDKARQGAFALEVSVGSFADPKHLGGLAHLVEHAVLLGDSSKPDGNLREFISRNRGKQNGQTSYEFTRYQVSVDTEALPESLKRFGDLLEEPRFSVAALNNEVKIVDEEFSLVKKKMLWRYRQSLKAVVDEQHPFHKFAAGNTESLGHLTPVELHAAAVRFVKDYYTPQRMRLVVVGNQSFEELEQAVQTAFGGLHSSPVALPQVQPLLQVNRLPAQIEIRTTGESPTLNLLFPLPEDSSINAVKPVEYLKYVLNHQGPGSLQEKLKAQGDIHQMHLSAGLNLGGQETLSIALALTPQGLQRNQTVVADLFAAFASLRERAVDVDLYESFRSMLAVQEFMPRKEKPHELALDLLKQQREYAVQDVRRGEFTAAPFNAERLGRFLAALNPDNALIILAHEQAKTDQVSPEYGIAYGIHPIDPAALAAWHEVQPLNGFTLAAETSLLPQDLRVQQKPNDTQPTLKFQTERVHLWHAFNRMGDTPRTLFHLALDTPEFGDTPANRALGEVWLEALQRRIKPVKQRAARSGQEIELYSHNRGMTLKASAFRDQAIALTRQALQQFGKPLSAEEFERAKIAVLRRWASPKHKYAFEPLVDELKTMLMRTRWSSAELAEALNEQTLASFETYRARTWQELKLIALSFGQVDEKELNAMNLLLNDTATQVEQGLPQPSPSVLPQTASETVDKLADGERRLFQMPLASKDSALLFYHQGEVRNMHEEAILQLLTPLLRNAYFEEVRGRRQLAYGVLVVPVQLMETPGLSFIIQSNKADPALLTNVTDQFLDGFGQYLRQLDPKVLQRLQHSMVEDLALNTTPAGDLANYFWREIGAKHYDFNQRDELAEALRRVQLTDLVAYVENEMAGAQERSLILQGWNRSTWPPQNPLAGTAVAAEPVVAGIPVAGTQTAGTTVTAPAIAAPLANAPVVIPQEAQQKEVALPGGSRNL